MEGCRQYDRISTLPGFVRLLRTVILQRLNLVCERVCHNLGFYQRVNTFASYLDARTTALMEVR